MRPTILVMDEDIQARESLGALLDQVGAAVAFVNDVSSALSYLKIKEVDVLFADLDSMHGNGLDEFRAARVRQSTLPVIATTAYGSVESTIDALRSGATDYLTKPYIHRRVLIALQRAIPASDIQQQQSPLSKGSRGEVSSIPIPLGISSLRSKRWTEKCQAFATSSSPVLIVGELGVGKERTALLIHSLSPRSEEPFVKVNCEAIQECLLRELFFGKANSADDSNDDSESEVVQSGFIERAAGGTLLLHNSACLPKWIQLEIIRAAQTGSFCRQDDRELRTFRARLVASTRCDPQESFESGELHEEFFHYFESNTLLVPPLRSRREDIRTLLDAIVCEASCDPSLRDCRHELRFTDDSLRLLEAHDWPGNFYELNGFVRRLLVFVNEPVVTAEIVAKTLPSPTYQCSNTITVPFVGDLREIQRAIVNEVIKRTRGNKSAAARTLSLHRKTLYRIIDGQPGESLTPRRTSA